MAKVTKTLITLYDGLVVVEIEYNDAKIYGTDDLGEPIYQIDAVYGTNLTSDTYRLTGKLEGKTVYIGYFSTLQRTRFNLVGSQKWKTSNSELGLTLI